MTRKFKFENVLLEIIRLKTKTTSNAVSTLLIFRKS